MRSIINLEIFLLIYVFQYISCDISLSTNDLTITLNEKEYFQLLIKNYIGDKTAELKIIAQYADIIRINPSVITLSETSATIDISVEGIGAGHSHINIDSTDKNINTDDLYVTVKVRKIPALDTFSSIIGWIYFIAWSCSFYPQIYLNYTRKSVVGLSFDFVSLNIVGFTLYSIFNCGLYFAPAIEEEYFRRFPRGLNPVQPNDIFFAIHAAFATGFTIFQCLIYERSNQRVSTTVRIILGIFGLFLFISLILASTGVIHWLDFLYHCSYVKLMTTLIKYVPQAILNYRRKSTVGWSIGNIFLDFTGGILSMLQMIVISYNYDDWVSIFGDPTKFGLGLFSASFDVLFFLQHYVFYRRTGNEEN